MVRKAPVEWISPVMMPRSSSEAIHDVITATLVVLASVREIFGVGALVSGDLGFVVLTSFELGDDSHVNALQSRYWSSLFAWAVVLDENLAQLAEFAVSLFEEVRDPGCGGGVLSFFPSIGAIVGAGPGRWQFVGILEGGAKICAAVRAQSCVLTFAGSHRCCSSWLQEIFREVLPDPGWGHHCNV